MSTVRTAMSRSSIDGAVVTKKFFVNGVGAEDNPTYSLDTTELPSEVQAMLCAYGANAAANVQITGVAKTATEAMGMWNSFVETLRDGTWSPGRGANEKGPSELALAIERFEQNSDNAVKHSIKEIMEVLDGLTPAQKRQLHSDPSLAPHIRAIRVERAREHEKAAKGKPSVLSSLFTEAA